MIPFDELCLALDRWRRRQAGEAPSAATEAQAAPEARMAEAESSGPTVAVDDEYVTVADEDLN